MTCVCSEMYTRVQSVTLKNNDVVERHGTQKRLHQYFNDKLIHYNRI